MLTSNVIGARPDDFSIKAYEWILWLWVLASVIEEVKQYFEEPEGYFELLTNQMDMVMYSGLITCMFTTLVLSL